MCIWVYVRGANGSWVNQPDSRQVDLKPQPTARMIDLTGIRAATWEGAREYERGVKLAAGGIVSICIIQ